MKPIAEWTVEELRHHAACGAFMTAQQECIDELLRRERERVARKFDELAKEWDGDKQGYYWADAACIVRSLQ